MIRCHGADDLAERFSRFSASLLAAGAITLGTAGCGTMTLPPRLSPAERAQIERVRFDADVGVTTEYPGHIRQDVVEILQDTGLFRKVADLEELSEPPDLVVTVTRRHGGKAIIPLLTLVTLGVLPTFFTDDVGYGLVIRSPTEEGRVRIDYHYTARGGLGFSSAVLNVLPGWHHPLPRPPRRLARRFALAIVAQEEEIRALLDEERRRSLGSPPHGVHSSEGRTGSSSDQRKSAGRTTRIPNRDAPDKCRTLYVTRWLARAATASSSTISSPRSRVEGL